jgi:hypothetical protein
LAIWVSGFGRIMASGGGHRRGGTRWQIHGTIVKRTCCGAAAGLGGHHRLASSACPCGEHQAEHRIGRNYLKGRTGDRANAILAAAGYNFALLLRWLRRLLRALFQALSHPPIGLRYSDIPKNRRSTVLHGRLVGTSYFPGV